jgi:predicted RNase H-like HicB family nuclease
MKTRLTAVISKEGNDYVALNPDLDIASQGDTPESALTNLREAVDLFFETASTGEIRSRLGGETWITQFEAEYAQA